MVYQAIWIVMILTLTNIFDVSDCDGDGFTPRRGL